MAYELKGAWARKNKPWRASVSLSKRSSIHLGYFATEAEAERKECQYLEEEYYGPPPMRQDA